MAHKTLTISEEAYEALASLKKEGESFTVLIKRIAAPLRKKNSAISLVCWAVKNMKILKKQHLR